MSILKKLKLTNDEFASLCRKTLVDLGFSQKISYQADQFCLHLGSKGSISYLSNAHRAYLSEEKPKNRHAVLQKFIQSILENCGRSFPKHLNSAKNDILPGVRENGFVETMRILSQFEYARPVSIINKAINQDFISLLQYNSENSISTLSGETLKT